MKIQPNQPPLFILSNDVSKAIEEGVRLDTDGLGNKLSDDDRAFHDWYRFVLSFPPHLVRTYLGDFGMKEEQTVLDPFCGTGTTLVESKLFGVQSFGIEANPVAHFASATKVNWHINPKELVTYSQEVAEKAKNIFKSQGINDEEPSIKEGAVDSLLSLNDEKTKLLIKNSISPIPLHKMLVLLNCIEQYRAKPFFGHMRLALANALVQRFSNLHFGPEVGVSRVKKKDIQAVRGWLEEINKMVEDLEFVDGEQYPYSQAYLSDSREMSRLLPRNSIDCVITSPPYPNEKDYTRTTRLESVLLGFINTKNDLRNFKKTLVRSNTRGVYKADDDERWVIGHKKIQKLAEEIENRRIELGKTSGFERTYARLTKLYFGGMARHLSELRPILRPGAKLAYVVGDQASYLRVLIRTGQLLAEIAQELGYQVERLDLFRTRFATATKEELREEVVVLRWKGK